MERIILTDLEMRELSKSFELSDEECETEKSRDDSAHFYDMMINNIEIVVKSLESSSYSVGCEDEKDIFVDFDVFHARIVSTELTAGSKRTEIEDLFYKACFDLSEGVCIRMDFKNHELRKVQRSLISRNGIYNSTEGS